MGRGAFQAGGETENLSHGFLKREVFGGTAGVPILYSTMSI